MLKKISGLFNSSLCLDDLVANFFFAPLATSAPFALISTFWIQILWIPNFCTFMTKMTPTFIKFTPTFAKNAPTFANFCPNHPNFCQILSNFLHFLKTFVPKNPKKRPKHPNFSTLFDIFLQKIRVTSDQRRTNFLCKTNPILTFKNEG